MRRAAASHGYDSSPEKPVDYERLSMLAPKMSTRVLLNLLGEISSLEDPDSSSISRINYELELRRGRGENIRKDDI